MRERSESDLPKIKPPVISSYDATESGNRSHILLLNIVDDTVITLVQQNSTFKAQLGHRYILREPSGDFRTEPLLAAIPQSPPLILPDTRHSFMWYNNELYYIYVDDSNVGVAKVAPTKSPASVWSIPLDNQGNQCAIDFDIADAKMQVWGTLKQGTRSRLIAEEVDL